MDFPIHLPSYPVSDKWGGSLENKDADQEETKGEDT